MALDCTSRHTDSRAVMSRHDVSPMHDDMPWSLRTPTGKRLADRRMEEMIRVQADGYDVVDPANMNPNEVQMLNHAAQTLGKIFGREDVREDEDLLATVELQKLAEFGKRRPAHRQWLDSASYIALHHGCGWHGGLSCRPFYTKVQLAQQQRHNVVWGNEVRCAMRQNSAYFGELQTEDGPSDHGVADQFPQLIHTIVLL